MKRLGIWLVPLLYQLIMTLIMSTCRVVVIGRHHSHQLQAQRQSGIYTAWHENTAVSVWAERGNCVAMMASDSSDGELIARAIERFGNLAIRGSSSRGGRKAAMAMIQALKSGHFAAMTPDGPRGPARHMQAGVLFISAVSQSPILPYHVVASREWQLRSWDKHRIPKPFSQVIISIGEPVYIDKMRFKQDEHACLAEVESLMQKNVEQAERFIKA